MLRKLTNIENLFKAKNRDILLVNTLLLIFHHINTNTTSIMIVWVRWTALPHPVESKKKKKKRSTDNLFIGRDVEIQSLLTSVNKRTHRQLSQATLTIIVRPVFKNEWVT